jgi:hypothetical protein
MDFDPRLLPHNLQWQGKQEFLRQDPSLRRLRANTFVHEPELLARLPLSTPGIYTLVGGRQVGKSTLLKQLMQRLLAGGTDPQRMAYVTCEPFVDAEIRRRGRGVVACRGQGEGEIDGIMVLPAAVVLLRMAAMAAA